MFRLRLLLSASTIKSPVHGLYKIDYIKSRSVPMEVAMFYNDKNDVMNERIYTHQSENNKASLKWHAAKFDSDSYGQKHYCLRSFKHELLCTSTSFELKWDVLDPYYIRKLHLKCQLMSEVGVFKITKFPKSKFPLDNSFSLSF